MKVELLEPAEHCERLQPWDLVAAEVAALAAWTQADPEGELSAVEGGRLAFASYAAALEGATDGQSRLANTQQAAAAVTRLLRVVLEDQRIADREAEVACLLRLLLGGKDPSLRSISLSALLQGLSALGVKESAKSLLAAESRADRVRDLAQAAQAARLRQLSLFKPRPLVLAEVAELLKDHGNSSPGASRGALSAASMNLLRQFLGRASPNLRMTEHLVRALSGLPPLPLAAVARGVAHAAALASTEAPFSGGEPVSVRARATALLEQALLETWKRNHWASSEGMVRSLLTNPMELVSGHTQMGTALNLATLTLPEPVHPCLA